jgi:hypothetical protein
LIWLVLGIHKGLKLCFSRAFLHADETGGRFTDGRLGARYASFGVDTAIAETVHHSTRRLRLSDGAFPANIQMRELVAGIDCTLVDIRGQQKNRPICTGRTITTPLRRWRTASTPLRS